MTLKPLLFFFFFFLSFASFGQTNNILQADLDDFAKDLSDEQLKRLIDYAQKLYQEPKKGSPIVLRQNKPSVFWQTSKYQLKKVEKGDILFLPFKYINTSDNPYQINTIKSNCDCVSTKVPTQDLLKNESQTLMLHIDTSKLNDHANITIIVYDNSIPRGKNYLFVNIDEIVTEKSQF